MLTLIIATFGTKRAHFGHSDKKVGVCNCLSWMNYVTDTEIADTTPPASPSEPDVKGSEITWTADADLESGIAYFVIERDGKVLATVPEKPKNPFGRPIFQGLQYSDTPAIPLMEMRYTDTTAEAGKTHQYRVITVNTAGLESK